MKCPRDGSILAFAEEGSQLINRCPECSGLLLEEHDVVEALGKRAVPVAEKLESLPQSSVACPRDGRPMRLLVHEGVEFDLCAECNALWLDAGEIEKIKRSRRGSRRKAALAAGAAAAVGGAAAAPQSSLLGGAAELGGHVAAEGAIEIACEVAVEAIGAVLGSLF